MKVIFELVVEAKNLASEIEQQRRKVQELTKAFKETSQGTEEYKKLAEELGEARVKLAELRKQQTELNREIKALAVPKDSLQGLRIEYSKLTAQILELSKAERESPQGQLLIKQAAALKQEINSIEESLGRFTGSVGNYQKGIIGIFDIVTAGLITGGIERAVDLIADTIALGVEEFANYEKALDRLSAITGVTGAKLEEFKSKVEALTTIRIGDAEIVNTAEQIAEAFTLVGSAQPELLESADALALVTEKALILSRASGDTLDTSVKALTTTLGQFKLQASEAERIMNELAAGAKAGSSEIPDTIEALQKFGTTAATVNVTTAESIALIQTLAEQQLKGSEAGTALRNILAKIASADVLPKNAQKEFEALGVNIEVLIDKTLPLETRLAELEKLAGNTSALVRVFGLENLNAANILVGSIDRFKEFVGAVEGTNEAYIQAETNSQNLSTAYENLKTKGINLLVEGFEEFKPLLAGLVNLFADALGVAGAFFKFFIQAPKFLKENKVELLGLATGLALLNGNLVIASANSLRLAAAERIRALATITTKNAQAALNAVMKANPIGLVITAVSLLALGFKRLYDSSETVRASISGLGNVANEIFKIVSEAVSAFSKGFDQLLKGDFSGAITSFGEAIVKTNPIGVAFTQGERLREAFNKGFDDKLAAEKAEKAEKEREERDKKEIKAAKTKVAAIEAIELESNKKRDTNAEALADKRLKEIEAQVKRINELRRSIRELNEQRISNKFDQEEIRLQNERLEALEAAESKRAELEKAIAESGRALSEQDREELALISEQTAIINALYDERAAELKQRREKAAEQQLSDLRALALETQKIAEENALNAIQAEKEVSDAALAIGRENLERLKNQRLEALEEQFAKGALSEKKYRRETLKANEEYYEAVLKLENEARDGRIDAVQKLTNAKVQAARVQLQAELFAIESALNADIDAIRQRAKEQGFDPSEQINQRQQLAEEQRAKARAGFARLEAEAAKLNAEAQIQAEKEIDKVKSEVHKNTLERLKEEKARREELKNATIQAFGEIASAAFNIQRNRLQQEEREQLAALEREFEARRKKAQGNAKQLEKIDAEYQQRRAEIEKETARQKKAIAIKEAIIQGALAFIKALPNYVLAAVVAIATAAQIAIISSQQFARGGALMFSGGGARRFGSRGVQHYGVFGGNLHSGGGTRGIFEDGTEVEVERDEVFVILNRRASKVLRALSEINLAFGGIPFAGFHGAGSFAGGGVMDFTPQIALPGASAKNPTAIIVQAEAQFSEEQIELIADRLSAKTAAATQRAIGDGLDDRDRRLERNNSLAINREG